MSPSGRFFHWILLLALFARPVAAETGPAPVRGVLFYAPDCAECAELFDFLLPALFERYGERLQLAAFDSSEPGEGRLFREAVRNPAPALPVLLVGTQTFSGMMDIAQGLGDGFEARRNGRRPEAGQNWQDWKRHCPRVCRRCARGWPRHRRCRSSTTQEGSSPWASKSPTGWRYWCWG